MPRPVPCFECADRGRNPPRSDAVAHGGWIDIERLPSSATLHAHALPIGATPIDRLGVHERVDAEIPRVDVRPHFVRFRPRRMARLDVVGLGTIPSADIRRSHRSDHLICSAEATACADSLRRHFGRLSAKPSPEADVHCGGWRTRRAVVPRVRVAPLLVRPSIASTSVSVGRGHSFVPKSCRSSSKRPSRRRPRVLRGPTCPSYESRQPADRPEWA